MSSNLLTILGSAARTASDVGAAVSIRNGAKGLIFFLKTTAEAHEAGDTLDVYIQELLPDGVTWNDFVHFTQVLGNGGHKLHVARVNCEVAPTTALGEVKDAALGVGVNQGPVCPTIRAKWTIAQSGDVPADGSFTFSVDAQVVR